MFHLCVMPALLSPFFVCPAAPLYLGAGYSGNTGASVSRGEVPLSLSIYSSPSLPTSPSLCLPCFVPSSLSLSLPGQHDSDSSLSPKHRSAFLSSSTSHNGSDLSFFFLSFCVGSVYAVNYRNDCCSVAVISRCPQPCKQARALCQRAPTPAGCPCLDWSRAGRVGS